MIWVSILRDLLKKGNFSFNPGPWQTCQSCSHCPHKIYDDEVQQSFCDLTGLYLEGTQ